MGNFRKALLRNLRNHLSLAVLRAFAFRLGLQPQDVLDVMRGWFAGQFPIHVFVPSERPVRERVPVEDAGVRVPLGG